MSLSIEIAPDEQQDCAQGGVRYHVTLPSGVQLIVDDYQGGEVPEQGVDVWAYRPGHEVRVEVGDTPADGFASYALLPAYSDTRTPSLI